MPKPKTKAEARERQGLKTQVSRSEGLSPDFSRVVLSYLSDLDTPRALTIWLMVKHGEFDQLVRQRVDPAHYLEHQGDKFARDYCASEFLRKCADLPLHTDRRQAALDNFFSSERQCSATNYRLAPYIQSLVTPDGTLAYRSEEVDPEVERYIQTVRSDIKALLGPVPRDLDCRYSKGTTFELGGHPCSSNLVIGDKIEHGPAFTRQAMPLAQFYWETAAGRALLQDFPDRSALHTVRGNRFTTVPKDALKDRGVCPEPGGNVLLQLGIGAVIRRRLERWGIGIAAGQRYHGYLAKLASLRGDLATIDLSNASDTVARGLVQLLLPRDWYDLLNALRSPFTRVDGRWHRLEKFSSMGNGFTFELETLIFAALCRGVGVDAPSVYGDDIIVPTARSADVLACLRFFGFTPNERKTFVSTSFRESCGTDSFAGTVVRPARVTKIPTTIPEWYALHNALIRARNGRIGRGCAAVVACLPNQYRLFGPAGLEDKVLHTTERRYRHKAKWINCIRYFRGIVVLVDHVKWSHFRPSTQLAMGLYGLEGYYGEIPTRNVSGFRITSRLPYS